MVKPDVLAASIPQLLMHYSTVCVLRQTCCVVTLIGALSASAQTSPQSQVDRDWLKLQDDVKAARQTGALASGTPVSRADKATAFAATADRLKTFYTANSLHSGTKDARRLEAMCLNYAAFFGNTTVETRRLAAVEIIRKDTTIDAAKRFEVVAWSNQVAINRLNLRSTAARLAEHERSARGLIAEFPAVHLGYDSLLAVARDSDPNKGKAIANDILLLSAPAHIRQQTQELLGRLALVGQSALALLTQAGAKNLADSANGKPVVVYAWSRNDASSLAVAKRLSVTAPNAAVIGVNLDADVAAAQATAASERLPGIQYFDPRTVQSPVALALKFSRPAQAYMADATGLVRDANALLQTREKLAGLGK